MDLNLAVVVGAWFVGGFVSGVSGIGGAMVAVPFAELFIPIQKVIVLSCILNLAMDGMLAVMHRRFCRIKALWPLLAGAIPGSIAGLFILKMMPEAMLRGGVGVLLLLFIFWKALFKPKKAGGESWPLGCLAGCAAGTLGTAISFDGPPAGAYGLYAGWPARVYLGTLGVFFVLRGLFACGLQASAGFYSPEVIHYAVYGFPATMLGALCSFPVVKRCKPESFQRVVKLVIALAALVCLVRAFIN